MVASRYGIKADMGEVVVGGKYRGRQFNAPFGGSRCVAETKNIVILAIAKGVAAEGLEIGHKGVVAAIGVERAGIELIAVAPTCETASCGRRGGEGDGLGVGAREGAATSRCAVGGIVGRDGDRGGRAKAIVGFDAYDGNIVKVEGIG